MTQHINTCTHITCDASAQQQTQIKTRSIHTITTCREHKYWCWDSGVLSLCSGRLGTSAEHRMRA